MRGVFSELRHLSRAAFAGLVSIHLCAYTHAQIDAPAQAAGSADSATSVSETQTSFSSGFDPDSVLRRLEQTESELFELRQSLATEDQRSGLLTAFQEQLSQARDPSITTVDEQTHRPAGAMKDAKKWYDRLSLRGYAQFRFNEVLDENEQLAPPHHVGDRSIGDNQSFLIRRARLIISGDLSDHMYVYLQPDFASSVPGSTDANQFAQIRDWYGDLYIDREKVYRFRIGQSKVPYGWENLQSSSNRLPLDRNDGLNSAVRNERDLGVFFYWTPEQAQDLFKHVLDEGLKGSGNYGVFGIGLYNGQGGSFNEQNDNLHAVVRLTYPFFLPSEQIVELGVQAYTGKYAVLASPIAPLGVGSAVRPLGTLETGSRGHRDERVAATFVWYPQPLGFQAEWNVGHGPALNDAQTEVVEQDLTGGYAMVMYRHVTEECGTLFPFARWNYFQGGYKSERNAPYSHINEWEFGVEWQFTPQMELTTGYTFTDRTNTTAMSTGESYGQFEGEILRMQFQINY
jgi:hypothetical protein